MQRALTTAAAVGLFVVAVVGALGFRDPLTDPPTATRTAQMLLALAALWPAGITIYLAAAGRSRPATIAAGTAGVLYAAIVAIAAPAIALPLLAVVAAAAAITLAVHRARRR